MEAIKFNSNTVVQKAELKNNQAFLSKKQKIAQDTVDINNPQEQKKGFFQKFHIPGILKMCPLMRT